MRTLAILFTLLFFSLCVTAQERKVTGKITDQQTNEPIAGATITIKGTNVATRSGTDGNFSILIQNPAAVLTISYVGMDAQEIQVGSKSNIPVALVRTDASIAEVIVTGYTTERKKDIAGAVSVVNMKDIASIPTGNVMSTLQGRVPGVFISNNGTPGGTGTDVSIRGITTVNNNSPLYVIDGVQTRNNPSTLLNPLDIESIQFLKDAASASIYGTQASNGVIIITTKKPGKNQLRIDFDAQFTAQRFRSGIPLLNAQQWGDAYWKAYQNDGVVPKHDQYGSGPTPVIPEFIDLQKTIRAGNTNWADEVYGPSFQQNYNVNVSRGSENGSSTFSFNYYDENGLIKYTNFTRFNVRFNSSYSFLRNRLRVGENVNISKWNQKLKPGGIEELTIAQHPLIPVYDINGGYAGPTQGLGDKPNPVRLLNEAKANNNNQWRIFGNGFLELEPVKNLIIRSNFGLNYRTGASSSFAPRWSEGGRSVNINSLTAESDNASEWIWSNTVAYNVTLGKHFISALAGTEAKESRNQSLSGTRQDFLIQALEYRYLSAGGGVQTNSGSASRTAINSYFGTVNYIFNNRYILSGGVRRDASSRFGKNNNAGIFPSVKAAWQISEENFMKNIDFISSLKLRATWGQTGNDQIDNEATYTKYVINLNAAGYDINGNNSGTIPVGVVKDRTGSANVKWEVTTEKNIGLDIALLNNRLSLSVDYFVKKTEDMLIDRPYIATLGEGGNMFFNAASMKNNGFEGIISWRDRIGKDFSYDVSFTGTAYKNEVTGLPPDVYYTLYGGNGRDKSIVGQPLGSWMGYRTNGLYRTQEELNDGITQQGEGLGRIRYVDIDNNGVINDRDRDWLGSDQPKFIGGLNVAVTYKSFDFAFFLNGVVRDAYNNSKFYTDFFQLWTGNHTTAVLNAWDAKTNFNSTIPALTAVNRNDEGRTSEYFIEDGSYIKMKNIQLGYTLPKRFADKLKLRNMRVYLQGQDLFTITKYSGADPEGLGYPYPIPGTFTLGFNFGF